MDRRIYFLVLTTIFALGIYLRVVDLGGPSLWHDEIIHLEATAPLTDQPWYRHLIGVKEVRGWTENGFIYYGLQILGQRLVPGEVGARLFPAVFGILSLPLMALCGGLFGGRLLALASTFLLSVAPLHVYFSREGRPYSLLMFLVLALLVALLQSNDRVRIILAWVCCLALAYVGIHSVPVLLAFLGVSVSAWLWGLRRGRPVWKSSDLLCAVAAVVALGLVYGLYMTRSKLNVVELDRSPIPIEQELPRTSQLESPVYESPLSRLSLERFLASMTTSGHQSRLLEPRSWAFLGIAMVGVLFGLYRRLEPTVRVALMFVLIAGLSLAALLAVDRWYGLRYTATALPAFVLLLAAGVVFPARWLASRLPGRREQVQRSVAAGLLTTLLLAILAIPNVAAARADPQRKLDWRGIARFFDEIALDDEPILMGNTWPQTCLNYYLRDFERSVRFVNLWESAARGEETVSTTARGWLLTAGFRKTDEVRLWMHRFQPVLKKREEEMALFFFPDFVTLVETRFAAGKGAVFERKFTAMERRFEFRGDELLLQGRGWSFPETNTAGIGYQWAVGPVAELGIPLDRPGPAQFRFRVLPFQYREAPPQSLRLLLNEEPLSTVELKGGWTEHEIEVPPTAWRSGANILLLEFARSTVPAQVIPGSGDRRELSAAFDFLELVVAEDPSG